MRTSIIRYLRLARVSSLCAAGTLAAGCSVTDLTKVDTPSNIVATSDAATETGAIALYRGALTAFAGAYAGNDFVGGYTVMNGMLADEFTSSNDVVNLRASNATTETSSHPYAKLSAARLNIDRATYALARHASRVPASYRGEMYALRGYIYVMMAELYCSGVPFSTVTADERVVLGTPLTTHEMYEAAIAQFDSAITVAADSARIQNLAKVGKGRAQVGLGDFAAASQSVADVPTSFVSNVEFGGTTGLTSYWYLQGVSTFVSISIADHEGGNGLPFTSANDPRLPLVTNGYVYIYPAYLPKQYVAASSVPIPLASGVEARLIQAEAALDAGDTAWLATLNPLRTDSTYTVTGTDTAWNAGMGGVAGLAPLADPGNDVARVDLLFRERAFWLFATGHRTGDLRRLIREYGRTPSAVFPVGTNPYAPLPPNVYGANINLEPPEGELANPNYHGCFNRDA
jgi:hypothetical protein